MKIQRETLLAILESVVPGTSKKDVLEQSSCVVFDGGRVMTFNDELACTMPLPDGFTLTAAVPVEPLQQILRKLPDDVIDVELVDGRLVVKGKGRKAEITSEAEIRLPIDSITDPDKWWAMPDKLLDALDVASSCAAVKKDDSFMLKCVHMTSDNVEACDNFQIIRYPVNTGLAGPALIQRDNVSAIKAMDADEMAESTRWIHFRGPTGMVLSCRRHNEEFPDLTPLLQVDDTSPTDLPKGLAEAAERAEVFSASDGEDKQVTVRLKANAVEITGEGASGKFTERKSIHYGGPPIVFQVAPSLLVSLVDKHNDAEVNGERLVVDGGNFRYVTCLGKV